MAEGHLAAVVRHLWRLVGDPATDDAADWRLLEQFTGRRDSDALAALVHRHGPMVLGVCRRVLGAEDDAEDAFQATFVVLLRKSGTLGRRGSLAGWLYTVAYRTALKMRAGAARRRHHERQARLMRPATYNAPEDRCELRRLLDAELERLPEKYRTPLVLCYLQGLTTEQAARQLGWPQGTVKGRLSRARALLSGRLSRRGVTLSSTVLGSLLVPEATASLSPLLASATVHAIQAPGGQCHHRRGQADAVVRQMAIPKVKLAALVFLTFVLAGIGSGVAAFRGLPPRSAAPAPGAPPALPPPADGRGDPLPPGAVVRLGSQRFRHGGAIFSLAFTPDGKALVSGSADGTVGVWDAATGKQLRRLPAGRTWVRSVALSPDGKRLAAAGDPVTVWEFATARPLFRVPRKEIAYAVAFAPDGKRLATADGNGAFRLWDLPTGKVVRVLRENHAFLPSVAFSPDGKLLATTAGSPTDEGTVGLWDTATGKLVRRLNGHKRYVHAVAFAPDGKTLASAGNDHVVCLWDVKTGTRLRRFRGHGRQVLDVKFAPDGKSLASAGGDGTARVWEVATGKQVFLFRKDFAGEGGNVNALAFAPDGKVLAAGSNERRIRLWDLTTGKEIPAPPGHEGPVVALAFAPDGKSLVSASFNGSMDSSVKLWDVASGKQRRQLLGGPDRASSVAFSPDGRAVAAGLDDKVYVWDPATGKELLRAAGKGWAVAFTDSGRVLASDRVRETRLWDVATGRRLLDSRQAVQAVAPGGMAATVTDTRLRLWSPETGEQFGTIALPVPAAAVEKDVVTGQLLTRRLDVRSAAFSPDGQTLATTVQTVLTNGGEGPGGVWRVEAETIHLWEVASGKEVARIVPPATNAKQFNPIDRLAFSPDGRTLAAGGRVGAAKDIPDALVLFWDAVSGKEVYRLHVPRGLDSGMVADLAFSPDGRTVATGGTDTTVLVWKLPPKVAGAGQAREALTPRELEKCWADLAGADVAAARRAAWRMTAAGEKAVALLGKRYPRGKEGALRKRVARLVADLDDDDFAVREAASRELKRLGRAARPALWAALARKPTVEARRRIDDLLAASAPGPGFVPAGDTLRAVRAIPILERIGTPAAREVLRGLADGAHSAAAAPVAQSALRQLALRHP